MRVTQARDNESRECDTGESYQLNVALFEDLMKAKGITKRAEQARKAKLPRSTLYRVLNHETNVTLRVANRFAKLAGASVQRLFERTHPPAGPSTPPPPPGPRGDN